MPGERPATSPVGTDRPATPHRSTGSVLAAAALLLLIDAMIAFLWHRPPIGAYRAGELAGPMRSQALSEALWAGGGNLVAALAAGLAAYLIFVNNPWGRTMAIVTITGFGFYRFTVLFDLLGDLVLTDSESALSAGVRLLLGIFILSALVISGFLLANRAMTRSERHRALIGADDGAEPPRVRELALLLIWYGIAWVVVAVVAFISFLLWTEYGSGVASLVYAGTIVSGTLGCIGGLALGGFGLAYWLGYTRRPLWRLTAAVAGVQLAGSTAFFLWESVPRIPVGSQLPGNGSWVFSQMTNLVSAVNIVVLGMIVILLWSPRLRRYFRSRR